MTKKLALNWILVFSLAASTAHAGNGNQYGAMIMDKSTKRTTRNQIYAKCLNLSCTEMSVVEVKHTSTGPQETVLVPSINQEKLVAITGAPNLYLNKKRTGAKLVPANGFTSTGTLAVLLELGTFPLRAAIKPIINAADKQKPKRMISHVTAIMTDGNYRVIPIKHSEYLKFYKLLTTHEYLP